MPERNDWKIKTAVAGMACLLLCLSILFGTRSILDKTIEEALRGEATYHSDNLVHRILEHGSEIERIAREGRATEAFLKRFRTILGEDDTLLQLRVFNAEGQLRYVYDEDRWIAEGGQLQSDAVVQALTGGTEHLSLLRGARQDGMAPFHSIVTLPVTSTGGETTGALEITQDLSSTGFLFERTFDWISLALPAAAAFLFLLPTVAWLTAQHRNGRNEALVKNLARRDRLTGLMNRSTFKFEAGQIIESELARRFRTGLLILDIDQFSSLNDVHGHVAADAYLKHVADTISNAVRSEDLVARFGGDEFVALLPDVTGSELADISNRIHLRLGQDFSHDGTVLEPATSIGTYLSQPGDTLDEAMNAAELALCHAKTGHPGKVTAYSDDLDLVRQRRRTIQAALTDAWAKGRAHMVFQPVIDANTLEIRGFEALMRLETEAGERIAPDEFIPIAEETGIIRNLGLTGLRRAIEAALEWPSDTFVAVNISPAQFAHGDLVDQVEWLLAELNFPAERLEVEITESLFLGEDDTVKRQFQGLKDLGVSIAMDDFGTGYSSLSYLLAHNFNKLKIDRMFLSEFHGDPERSRNILRLIISLGRQIGMTVTVEGVEFPQQETLLASMGCDLLQGFLYSRPLARDAVPALFADWAARQAEKNRPLRGPVLDTG